MKPGPLLTAWLWLTMVLACCVAVARLLAWPPAELLALAWVASIFGLALLALVDAVRVRKEAPIEVRRRLPRSLALGRSNRVEIQIRNPLHRRVLGRATDHYPPSLRVGGVPVPFSLMSRGELDFEYQVEPTERGEVFFGPVELELNSPWGFWRLCQMGAEDESLRVYPDFMTLESLRQGSYEHNVARVGVHLQRKRGEGTDFQQLREYREGDVLRQVDWKASARLCKLISREYQDEHDRDIIFLLDCGRRMHGRDLGLSHFDHALNAILLTAYFALRQGDGVGVCTFAGRPMWLQPVKHRTGLNRLLDQLYDLQATTESTDFLEAAQLLASRRSKRALVVLVSNVQAEDDSDLASAIDLLRKRHAVIFCNLRESALVDHLQPEIASFDSALKHCVAVELTQGRQRVLDQLRHRGAWVVDCLPRHLHQQMVAQYLALKRSGAL